MKVCRAVTMRRQRNRHILNEFSQSLEGEKNLICRRLSKKKNSVRKFHAATAKKSVRHHRRAVRAE